VFDPVFVKSASRPGDFPADIGLEVAVVGRSNSGKSSAINAMTGRRKLARVSKTPGRTQQINFFSVAPEKRIVDLPGYGFARVPPGTREQWRVLIEAYFQGRRSLAGLIVTIDVRRGLKDLDRQMIGFARAFEVPTLLLLTKSDKLSRKGGIEERDRVSREVPEVEVALFSAPKLAGVDEARARLERWLEVDDDGANE